MEIVDSFEMNNTFFADLKILKNRVKRNICRTRFLTKLRVSDRTVVIGAHDIIPFDKEFDLY